MCEFGYDSPYEDSCLFHDEVMEEEEEERIFSLAEDVKQGRISLDELSEEDQIAVMEILSEPEDYPFKVEENKEEKKLKTNVDYDGKLCFELTNWIQDKERRVGYEYKVG